MSDSPKNDPNLATLQALRCSLESSLRNFPSQVDFPQILPILGLNLAPNLKLKVVDGKKLLRENLEWDPQGSPRGLEKLRTALNVLEKYGRNLLSPNPPKHWRAVRFGNPVFRSTVGAVKGGRSLLVLLGYTEQVGEGLSFPPPPAAPSMPRVAALTADVIILRRELELLLANQHPNPQFFAEILLGGEELSPKPDGVAEVLPAGWSCCSCTLWNEAENVLCRACERPRLARRPAPSPSPTPGWPCPLCTFLNPGHAHRCDVCGATPTAGDVIAAASPASGDSLATSGDHPPTSGSSASTSGREKSSSGLLATTPTTSGAANVTSGSKEATSGSSDVTSGVDLPVSGAALEPSGGIPTTSGVGSVTSGAGNVTSGAEMSPSCGCDVTSGAGPAPSRDAQRQRKLLEDGRRLVELVRAAEAEGFPPESLSPALLQATPTSGPAPSPDMQMRHFRVYLKRQLEELQGAWPGGGVAELGAISLAEAAWAWLEGEGQPERARSVLIGRRRKQLLLLASLGFPESSAALQASQGDQWEALRALQEVRLKDFLLRHFRGAGPALDFRREDQQALIRQILATLPVASWGRALLVSSLGRELGLGRVEDPSKDALLGELVEAVGSCGDRAVLLRRLRCECAVCGWRLPRRMMQWLPGCCCPLCPECFRLHFTVGVRERGVASLGCPSCGQPDLRDEGKRLWYWSTLEPGLRRLLDADTFGLVTRKLTELELLRDPQFLWCPHCSFGFIFEADRGPTQCPQCHQCCCPRCQLPWDPQHQFLSCAEFQIWIKTQNSPNLGLKGFLGEMGIACPRCSQSFSLARGGCLHFRCSRCQHQFCSGCGEQFHPPGSCPVPSCSLLNSLHSHHPRDCLFFLRDWEPQRLQQILLDAKVPFETKPPAEEGENQTGQCPVVEQKEFGVNFRDESCGRRTAAGQAGLCRSHYVEYLVSLINRHGLDPAPLYDPAELRAAAERHLAAGRSRRLPGESEAEQRLRMLRALGEEAPLRPRLPGAGLGGICK